REVCRFQLSVLRVNILLLLSAEKQSKPQKDFTLIKESHQAKAESDDGERHDHIPPGSESLFHRAAYHELRKITKAEQVKGQIDCNRIHPDPDKGDAPFAPLPHLDHLVKGRQEQTRVTRGHQHI